MTDLSKVSVGHIGILGGQPVDFAKSVIYDRAGLPLDAEEREGLKYTHGSAEGKDVPRLPAVFPPAVLPGSVSLSTAQDYLDLIAATPVELVPSAAEMAAQKKAEQQAAQAQEATKAKQGAEEQQITEEQQATEVRQTTEVRQAAPPDGEEVVSPKDTQDAGQQEAPQGAGQQSA